MPRRSVQLALAFLVAFAAVAAEFPVSDIVLGTPPGSAAYPSAASDGDGFLVAWSDGRGVESQLLAARITRGGQILDPTGILLERGNAGRPQVIWNGQRYLVFTGGKVIEVNRDGTAGAPRAFLDNTSFFFPGTTIATNGSRIVLVYGDVPGASGFPDRLHAGVFTMDATPVGETVVEQAFGDLHRMSRLAPSVAVNGSQFAVAWNLPSPDGQFELKAVRLASNGSVMDAPARAIGSSVFDTAIAANGAGYVAVNTFYSWGVSGDLGTVTAPAEHSLALGDGAVVVQRSGHATLLGTQQEGENVVLSASDFDDQGHGAAPKALAVATEGALAAASNGSEIAVMGLVYETAGDVPAAGIVSTIVSASTMQRLTEAVPLTRSASRQSTPAIAASGSGMLAAWLESGDVYAGRLLSNGTRLDGRGILLSSGERDGFPSVVFDGQRYVVAFTHYKGFRDTEVVVRFVSPQSGLLPNEIRIPSADAGYELALAKGNDAVLLVWMDDMRMLASRINGAMQAIDPPVEIATDAASPAASWNGTEFLIAWRTVDFGSEDVFYRAISGMRMSASMTPIDTERVLAQVPDRQHVSFSIASNGPLWLMAFATRSLFPTGPDEIRAVALNGGIPVGGGATFNTIAGAGFFPQLVTAGSRTWLAWKEGTSERALRVVPLTSAGQVDPSAVQRFAAPTPVGVESQWQERFGLAANGSQVLLAYPRFAGIEAGYVPRVYVSSFGETPVAGKRRSAKSP